MNWTLVIIVGIVFAALFILKRKSLVPAAAARKLLREGALVIDVRSPQEFRGGHLPKVINIPLDDLTERLPRQVKDKNTVLLLHCLSGGRSGIAAQQLKRMGYANVFNLGSFGRARRLVGGL